MGSGTVTPRRVRATPIADRLRLKVGQAADICQRALAPDAGRRIGEAMKSAGAGAAQIRAGKPAVAAAAKKAAAAVPNVEIYTDGGCQGNPGIGAWAAVLKYGPKRKEIHGGELATTNNRMELRAAIEALRLLKKRCRVVLHSDSQYVKNGITQWIHGWKRNGWTTAGKTPVKNADLWRALDEAASVHELHWQWVKGHAGVTENERCDMLANDEMQRIRRSHSREELARALQAFHAAQEGGKLL